MIPQHIWQAFTARHSVGDVINGVVTDVVPFGAFVEYEGVTGLAHQAEWPTGERVEVRILAIEEERQRFSLEAV